MKVRHDFTDLITDFLEWRTVRNMSPGTIDNDRYALTSFQQWCSDRGIVHPGQVNADHIAEYNLTLYKRTTRDGRLIKARTRAIHLTAICLFFRWLTNNSIILTDPTRDLVLPQYKRPLPSIVLSMSEIESILEQADHITVIGLRDRSIMELLYSTGIRRQEASNLTIRDIALSTSTVFVRQGKGKKDRLVPLGDRSGQWLQRYLIDSRPYLVKRYDHGGLYLSKRTGKALKPCSIGQIVKNYIKQSGINRKGSCHLFRHAMATGMLENGADIRSIQSILGHAKLTTTQIYTTITIKNLKNIHKQYHPFEKKPKKS